MRLVGDTSYGAGCAEPGFPGVYGRLADETMREWVRSIAPDATSTGSTSTASSKGGKAKKQPSPSRASSPSRAYR
jgi:hypothetical protein